MHTLTRESQEVTDPKCFVVIYLVVLGPPKSSRVIFRLTIEQVNINTSTLSIVILNAKVDLMSMRPSIDRIGSS